MKSSLSLSLTLIFLVIMTCTVEDSRAFSVALKSGINQRKFSPRTTRDNSLKLERLEKLLRKQATLKSKLHSLNKFLKKYEAKVGNILMRLYVI